MTNILNESILKQLIKNTNRPILLILPNNTKRISSRKTDNLLKAFELRLNKLESSNRRFRKNNIFNKRLDTLESLINKINRRKKVIIKPVVSPTFGTLG